MDRFAFLIQTPFSSRDYKRFGVDLLLKRGVKVDILDLTKAINPGYCASYQVNGASDYKGVHKIGSAQDLDRYVQAHPGTMFIDFIGGRAKTYFVYQIFKKFGSVYAVFAANPLPGFAGKHKKRPSAILDKLPGILKVQKYKEKAFYYLFLIADRLGLVQKPAYILAGGFSPVNCVPSKNRDTKTIYAHTLDYDIYLDQIKKGPAEKSRDYAVFLDEFFPLHPDFLVQGDENNPYKQDAAGYFSQMRDIFGKIENELKVPVVIAAHPRAKYDGAKYGYGDRTIVEGRTCELAAGAKYVLLHSSTSINFPVLFKKPMVFIMAPGIKGSYYESQISGMAGMFGVIPYTGEPGLGLEETMARPSGSYGVYKESYIKTEGSEEKYFWDIIADKILGEIKENN